jgi:hypothetical protein
MKVVGVFLSHQKGAVEIVQGCTKLTRSSRIKKVQSD